MKRRSWSQGNTAACLEHFVACIDEGSMQAAGVKLGLSTPTISKSILRLEHRLQARLLHRTTRHTSPTLAGLEFYERAQRIVQEVKEAEAIMAWAGATVKCAIRIVGSEELAARVVGPLFVSLRRQHPRIDLHIEADDFEQPPQQCAATEVWLWTGGSREDGQTRRLAATPQVFLASTRYLGANGCPVEIADLRQHLLIVGKDPIWTVTGSAGTEEYHPIASLKTNSTQVAQQAILADIGIGLVDPLGLEEELGSGKVQRVLADYQTPPDHGLWARFSDACHPAVRIVLEHLQDMLNETTRTGQGTKCAACDAGDRHSTHSRSAFGPVLHAAEVGGH